MFGAKILKINIGLLNRMWQSNFALYNDKSIVCIPQQNHKKSLFIYIMLFFHILFTAAFFFPQNGWCARVSTLLTYLSCKPENIMNHIRSGFMFEPQTGLRIHLWGLMKSSVVDIFRLQSEKQLSSRSKSNSFSPKKQKNLSLSLILYIQYLTKVSTPFTFQQLFYYIFSRDDTIKMKLGYILE